MLFMLRKDNNLMLLRPLKRWECNNAVADTLWGFSTDVGTLDYYEPVEIKKKVRY